MKPDVLSDEERHKVWIPCETCSLKKWNVNNATCMDCFAICHEQAQRDADVAYYEPIIQQAAREIFEEIDEKYWHQGSNNVWYVYMSDEEWQSLKSKYLEVKK